MHNDDMRSAVSYFRAHGMRSPCAYIKIARMLTWERLPGADAAVYAISKTDVGDWLAGTHDGLWHLQGGAFARAGLAGVPLTAVAGTRRAWLVGAPDGIARSDDRGASWSMASDEAGQIAQIALSPVFNKFGIAFAAALNGGALRSFDIGLSWAACNQGLPEESAYAVHVADDFLQNATLLTGREGGVWRSLNAGTDWEQLDFPHGALPVMAFVSGSDCVWACTDGAGIFRTADHGTIWTQPGAAPEDGRLIASASDGALLAVVRNAGDIALSRDGGVTWQYLAGPDAGVVSALALDEDTLLCGAQDGGVWRAAIPA